MKKTKPCAACNAPKTTEAEAIARLREAADHVFSRPSVDKADLRAVLDARAALETAHTEALDALKRKAVDVSADRTWCSLCRTEAPWNLEPDRADRHPHAVSCVLAKAGRR